MKITAILVLVVAGLAPMPGAWAHRYIENDGTHTTAERAIPLGDIGLSQVVYHEVTAASGSLWMSFDATAGMEASIELGVPFIERFASYRPAFALLGPGLPPLEQAPVPVPEGCGGIVFTTDAVKEPEIFDEEFTGTESWVFGRQDIVLPQNGTYYIVAFVPSGTPGKLWVAPGIRESFGFMDIVTLPRVIYKVRTFHEVFFWGGILGWAYLAIILILLLLFLGIF
ncbi:MAG: hypothetical protein BWX80_02417 [Candidatus Hydrogenedentes bacterium ADurb.Bin101]|jgi:hypothetical protein|nr:hypothetical protein [Candidatus Hydrogenedentota bacterium]OQC04577.1 MAG: hypothetical protein BWX80_02417 [Candidatus Hydrogenedentes bacterium ADurb.Bin101]HOC70434.1 hypothetical protein [Candidatus Hydrogenedentota bacterium]